MSPGSPIHTLSTLAFLRHRTRTSSLPTDLLQAVIGSHLDYGKNSEFSASGMPPVRLLMASADRHGKLKLGSLISKLPVLSISVRHHFLLALSEAPILVIVSHIASSCFPTFHASVLPVLPTWQVFPSLKQVQEASLLQGLPTKTIALAVLSWHCLHLTLSL